MYEPFADRAAMREWLDGCAASSDPLFMTIESRDAGPVGMAAFMNIVPEHRRLEIGHIWYAPSAQRTEANTEAAYLMMREAFDELGYRRVEWKCDALNARSRAAALRLGFTFEGVFRAHMIVRGRNRDSAWFSLLDTEWPAAQGRARAMARTPTPRTAAARVAPRGNLRPQAYAGSLPARHLMPQPMLARWSCETGPPERTASIAARRSSPVTGSPLLGRLSSSCPR